MFPTKHISPWMDTKLLVFVGVGGIWERDILFVHCGDVTEIFSVFNVWIWYLYFSVSFICIFPFKSVNIQGIKSWDEE